jgi:hypothetical protein
MRDIMKHITVNGKEYPVVFNLNVMEEIQEEYGTVDKWGELTEGGESGEPNAKAVIFGFTHMVNEGIDIENEKNGTDVKPLTFKQVGRILTELGIEEMAKTMQNTVIESTKSTEKNA